MHVSEDVEVACGLANKLEVIPAGEKSNLRVASLIADENLAALAKVAYV
jgi:hypothetical protein